MHASDGVVRLLQLLALGPLAREEAAHRFGRSAAEFEAALERAGTLVRHTLRVRPGQEPLPCIEIAPDGRQVLQALSAVPPPAHNGSAHHRA